MLNLKNATYTSNRWKLVQIEAGTPLDIAYVKTHLSSASLSSSNQHLQSAQVCYINLSDLQATTWQSTANPKPVLVEIIAETESHYLAHFAQSFVQLYDNDWLYSDYLETVQAFRNIMGQANKHYHHSIAVHVPKASCKAILPFRQVGESYLIWEAAWSRWFDWDVYFYPQTLADYGLDLSHVQTSLIYDPSIWLDLTGFRLNLFAQTGAEACLKVYPRSTTSMPSIATNLSASFEDSIIEVAGNLPLVWEVYKKQLHISLAPKK